MADNNAVLHSNNLLLLTLNGQIIIHFMDGKTLSGEFATQDAFNIFLTVNEEPLMIPRTQIRYIKGQSGQQIEEDDSQRQFLPTLARQQAEKTIDAGEQPTLSDDEEDPTLFITPDDTDDATMVIGDDDDDNDDDDATVFITEDEEDATVFIKEEDDTTMVIDDDMVEAEQPVITAYLDCITGPHTGDRFELQSGVTTLGRSTDNIFALSKDKEISRRHALFTYQDGKFIVEDRGSLNGVIVNNVRIDSPRQLEHGDSILIGVSTFVFYEK